MGRYTAKNVLKNIGNLRPLSREGLKRTRNLVSFHKIAFRRGYEWISIPGMALVITSVLQRHLPWDIPMYILFPVGILGIWIIGMIDEHSGSHSNDLLVKGKKNPIAMETLKNTREIREVLKR